MTKKGLEIVSKVLCGINYLLVVVLALLMTRIRAGFIEIYQNLKLRLPALTIALHSIPVWVVLVATILLTALLIIKELDPILLLFFLREWEVL